MVRAFFGGLFLINGVPHFVKGITGQTHMTPFKRVSSPYLNVVWGFLNFILGLLLLGFSSVGSLNFPTRGEGLWAFILGAFFISMMDAQLFSKPDARLPWHKD